MRHTGLVVDRSVQEDSLPETDFQRRRIYSDEIPLMDMTIFKINKK